MRQVFVTWDNTAFTSPEDEQSFLEKVSRIQYRSDPAIRSYFLLRLLGDDLSRPMGSPTERRHAYSSSVSWELLHSQLFDFLGVLQDPWRFSGSPREQLQLWSLLFPTSSGILWGLGGREGGRGRFTYSDLEILARF